MMELSKEVKKQLDKWYDEYVNVNKHFPTIGEVRAKAKELEEK